MKEKEKKIIILLLLIIIILIILFFLTKKIGVIDVALEIPTGNVDIFDITIVEKENKENYCKCEEIGRENCECINNIEVYDKEVEYTNNTQLNIFSHQSYYIADKVIAPESQNTYQFIIRNNNDFPIEYSLKMEEINPFNINMRYRLKLNGDKIIGDENNWVTAEELLQNSIILADDSYNVYSLDWKWFESSNDTEIGKNIEANYKLNISFFAERY